MELEPPNRKAQSSFTCQILVESAQVQTTWVATSAPPTSVTLNNPVDGDNKLYLVRIEYRSNEVTYLKVYYWL